MIVLCGGLGYPSTRLPDTWEYNVTTWTLRNTAPVDQEVYEHRMVYDPVRQEIVPFGGVTAGGKAIGTGCASSAGLPTLAAAPGSLPFVGQPFALRMDGIPVSYFNPAFLGIGLSTTQWSGLALPLALAPYGMPGCTAWVAADIRELMSAQGGVATKTWNIPASPTFIGVEFHAQGAVLDPGVNTAGFAVSNGVTIHIGRE